MIENKISAMFSQDPEVGVKYRVTPRCLVNQGRRIGVLVDAVIVFCDVQVGARVGGGDLAEEFEELLVPVASNENQTSRFLAHATLGWRCGVSFHC